MPKRSTGKSAPTTAPYAIRELLRDLWKFYAPYKGRLIAASFLRLMGDVAYLVPWYALSRLVDELGAWRTGMSVVSIYWWLWAMMASFMVRSLCMYGAKRLGFLVGEKAALDVREQGMAKLLRLDIAWHERENAGNKLKRIDSGADAVYRFIRIWIANIIEIGVTLAGSLVIMATNDGFVSIATLVFLIVYTPISSHMGRKANAAARLVNVEMEKVSGTMFESLNNVRTAKVLDMRDALLRIIRTDLASAFSRIKVRVGRYQTSNLTRSLLSTAFRAGATVYIVHQVIQGRFEVGFLVLFGGYFNRLTDSAVELAEVAQDMEVARHSIARMMEIFREPVIDPGTLPYPADWKVISLRNVSYSYGDRAVLDGITFDIRRGERVGLVGLSGAGKSTLFKLLLKELEDYTGEILVDGVPLRDIKKSEFYRRAAVVLQETEVFNFSLRQNITIASRDTKKDKERLSRALEIAHVSDFLRRMPKGVDTLIGEKGIKLSGGERQRVGIARAIYKHPDILFLDEATSHLDLESEERIRDSLHAFFQKVTAVVIAHRLTTIRAMDRIIVMEGGKLLEQGSFEQLYAARGRFHELWEKQKLG